ncbi:MAG TPA: CPBP family intramembrane metalloprotease [Bacteroidales bacterium]|jgi:hypothetical protein|nr:CPBP family intramembrane metalloprotease [Bacteroidales bacterium]HRS18561.1 CPBP family intramembrane metalloprotease [Bacteroidales bacterium]
MKLKTCIIPEQFYSLSIVSRIFIGFIFSIIFGLLWFYAFMFIGSIVWRQTMFDFIEQVSISVQYVESKALIQFLLFTQSISIFLIPAIVMSKIIRCDIISQWKLNKFPNIFFMFLIIQIIIINIPGMNFWAGINTYIVELFASKESFIYTSFIQNQKVTEFILKAPCFADLLVNICCIAIVPAITEELFFRGMLQRYATAAIGKVQLAIVLTSIIFSLLHGDLYNFIPRFCMGIIFGYLYWYTNNLWVPIIAHFIHNASVVVSYYVIQHGVFHPNFEKIGMWGNASIFGFVSIIIVAAFMTYMVSNKMHINLSEKEDL